ncbi:hypothetical protein LCGC14_2944320, partial [marine sediment metagenome]
MHLRKSDANRLLKNKIRKVGSVNVKVQFLNRNLTEEEAFRQEKYWIKYYGRRDLGTGTLCNLTDGGEGESGQIVLDTTKKKISNSMKGHIHSEGTKQKMRGTRKPYGPQSEDHKRKLSKTRKGRPTWMKGKKHTDEAKQKMSVANKGKSAWNNGVSTSDKTRRKISEANRGHFVSKETKQKISRANKGRKLGPMPDETKQKLSITMKRKLSFHKDKEMSDEIK